MASATKLSSGAWRCRPTITVNGKKVTKSFTVHPKSTGGDSRKAKAKAEMMAREWQIEHETVDVHGFTVEDALRSYIDDRRAVLSPSTIFSYEQMIQYFDSIKDIYVQDVDSPILQRLINDMAVLVGYKTIKNRLGLIISALDYAGCDKKYKLRYPQRVKKDPLTPDIDEVMMLIRESDPDFKPIICLAAFGTLRRGEIAALKKKDVSRDMCLISVHADMVRSKGESFVYKSIPKTSSSIRSVSLPKDIIDLLPDPEDPEDFLFNLSPNAITHKFIRLRDRLGLKCSFHSLRHFAASFMSDIGIPKKYIESAGGWAPGSDILSSTYDNNLRSSKRKYIVMTNNYIDETFGDVIKGLG